ncbi:hypothetical protein AYI68_g3591 [Smittium mucronatum]|uniref:PH domain-containing protein n=1 Tax=Smittium mucronatum TaxID=133383 RepID=A0A1R0GZJ5_9FUNG|nr:hypothetical protein AYI68_g3591 [Smittium mucronatum]
MNNVQFVTFGATGLLSKKSRNGVWQKRIFVLKDDGTFGYIVKNRSREEYRPVEFDFINSIHIGKIDFERLKIINLECRTAYIKPLNIPFLKSEVNKPINIRNSYMNLGPDFQVKAESSEEVQIWAQYLSYVISKKANTFSFVCLHSAQSRENNKKMTKIVQEMMDGLDKSFGNVFLSKINLFNIDKARKDKLISSSNDKSINLDILKHRKSQSVNKKMIQISNSSDNFFSKDGYIKHQKKGALENKNKNTSFDDDIKKHPLNSTRLDTVYDQNSGFAEEKLVKVSSPSASEIKIADPNGECDYVGVEKNLKRYQIKNEKDDLPKVSQKQVKLKESFLTNFFDKDDFLQDKSNSTNFKATHISKGSENNHNPINVSSTEEESEKIDSSNISSSNLSVFTENSNDSSFESEILQKQQDQFPFIEVKKERGKNKRVKVYLEHSNFYENPNNKEEKQLLNLEDRVIEKKYSEGVLHTLSEREADNSLQKPSKILPLNSLIEKIDDLNINENLQRTNEQVTAASIRKNSPCSIHSKLFENNFTEDKKLEVKENGKNVMDIIGKDKKNIPENEAIKSDPTDTGIEPKSVKNKGSNGMKSPIPATLKSIDKNVKKKGIAVIGSIRRRFVPKAKKNFDISNIETSLSNPDQTKYLITEKADGAYRFENVIYDDFYLGTAPSERMINDEQDPVRMTSILSSQSLYDTKDDSNTIPITYSFKNASIFQSRKNHWINESFIPENSGQEHNEKNTNDTVKRDFKSCNVSLNGGRYPYLPNCTKQHSLEPLGSVNRLKTSDSINGISNQDGIDQIYSRNFYLNHQNSGNWGGGEMMNSKKIQLNQFEGLNSNFHFQPDSVNSNYGISSYSHQIARPNTYYTMYGSNSRSPRNTSFSPQNVHISPISRNSREFTNTGLFNSPGTELSSYGRALNRRSDYYQTPIVFNQQNPHYKKPESSNFNTPRFCESPVCKKPQEYIKTTHLLDLIPKSSPKTNQAGPGSSLIKKGRDGVFPYLPGNNLSYKTMDKPPLFTVDAPQIKYDKRRMEPINNLNSRHKYIDENTYKISGERGNEMVYKKSNYPLKNNSADSNRNVYEDKKGISPKLKKNSNSKQPSEKTLINSNYAKNSNGDFIICKDPLDQKNVDRSEKYFNGNRSHSTMGKYVYPDSLALSNHGLYHSLSNNHNQFSNMNKTQIMSYSVLDPILHPVISTTERTNLSNSFSDHLYCFPGPRFKIHPATMKTMESKNF